jgi:hypothetical protein
MSLLFVLAKWHSLAKLRLHTDHTLDLMDNLTTELGEQFRMFETGTCLAIKTKELPREYQAQKRREARRKANLAPKTSSKRCKLNTDPATATGAASGKTTPEGPASRALLLTTQDV